MIQESSTILNDDVWCIGDPDPDLAGLKVTGWRLVLLPVRQKAKTKGGAYIPESTLDDMQTLTSLCKVLQVGDFAYSREIYEGKPFCKVGDYVLIPRITGMKIRYNGVPLILAADSVIEAVIENPEKLDKHK